MSDLRRIARRRLPRGVFDYIDGAAEDELTLARNSAAFRQIEFAPRVLASVGNIDTSTTLLGHEIPIPLMLSPTGFTRIVTPAGELDVARAAGRAKLPYALSTLGTRSIEEVAEVATGPTFYQLYVWRDRGLVREMIERVKACNYDAILFTVDTVVQGRRERDVRRGFTLPPKIGPGTLVDGVLHPAWTMNFLRSDPILFSNMSGSSLPDGSTAVSLGAIMNDQFDPGLAWSDLDWLRQEWSGPLVIKGVQCVEDAIRAAKAGVDAIALSNHGGRQLDGAPAVVELVQPVVDAIGDYPEVICDGGVRRGSDVVKAVALGARACSIGRSYLYGLAAAGERGVDRVLEMFKQDIHRTMALAGCRDLASLTPDVVRWRAGPG